ncbi:FRG domain-containing protein [Microbulbifer sp. GL-2]|uniref:FRG domain-containing protein n=1 Tax=Microbulbifer sp. GL-2 TaxID=2591606 RepID=UPI0011643031|nr:FRG domain-containing protein [Microbulbifer sp. GL-2]BBM01472.1 hypothetical protein GL2_15460 [Microbulbifer sp. GL-2]
MMEAQCEKYLKREEKYYKNLPLWPKFDIYNQTIDGLIPATRLDSWEQFHDIVKYYRTDEDGAEFVFRGQHNYRWELQPTLDRMSPGAIQEDIAKKQLRNFRLSIRGRVHNSILTDTDDEELWAIGQHHGLATPLLDWSLAPYVALFFAFVNEDPVDWEDSKGNPTNHSRAIYILNKSFIEDLVENENSNPLADGYPKIVEPSKDDHGRLVNQAGLFTISPYGETIESALLKALTDSEVDIESPDEISKYICKLHIPNSEDCRRECLKHLRKMNIHHANLFPDVIGASGYCNELISESIEAKNRKLRIAKEKQKEKISDFSHLNSKPKEFSITETNDVFRTLINSLFIDDSIRQKANELDLSKIAETAVDFIDNKAGPDWYDRESQLARLKNILRRQLKNSQFPYDFISPAAERLASTAAEMSRSKEKESTKQAVSLISVGEEQDCNTK